MSNQLLKFIPPQSRNVNRAVIFSILAIQVLVLLLLSYFSWRRAPEGTFTLRLYYDYSLNFLRGQVPYRDFAFEYPPLALLPMILPHWAKLGQTITPSEYARLFMVENVLLSLIGAIAFIWMSSRWQCREKLVLSVSLYSVLVIVTAPVMLGRYDLFPTLLTMLAVMAAINRQAILAGGWLAFGIAAKLYPVILLPVFSLYYLARRDYSTLLRFGVGMVGGTVTSMLFVWRGMGSISSFLSYHQDRGLQLESIPAGIIVLAKALGLTEVSIVSNFGAKHIVSPLADNVLGWLSLLSLVTFVGLIAFCFVVFRRDRISTGQISAENLAIFALLTLLVFIATGKVFSPQYVVWLIPFVPFLRISQAICVIVISLMTVAIYPFLYDRLLDFDMGTVILLNLRNFLLILLLFWLILERSQVLSNQTRDSQLNKAL